MGCSKTDDFSDVPPVIEPIEVVRDVEGYDFFWPMSIAEDDGKVFIADFRDCCIHVFDHSLTHLDSIGRKGEGPGEFEALIDISAKNGILAALNLAPPRISLFDYSGNPLREIPVSVTRWGDIEVTDQNTILLARYFRGSDSFITEYSTNGEIISEMIQHPDQADTYTSFMSQCRVRYRNGQGYLVFEQIPRIVGFGESTIDVSHDLTIPFPFFKKSLKFREKLKRKYGRRSIQTITFFGGFDIIDNYLIIAGPWHHLMVFDRISNEISHVNMGFQGWELSQQHALTNIRRSSNLDGGRRGTDISAANTYWDMKSVGEEMWMISTMNSCLIKFSISEIITAAESGTYIPAIDYQEPPN